MLSSSSASVSPAFTGVFGLTTMRLTTPSRSDEITWLRLDTTSAGISAYSRTGTSSNNGTAASAQRTLLRAHRDDARVPMERRRCVIAHQAWPYSRAAWSSRYSGAPASKSAGQGVSRPRKSAARERPSGPASESTQTWSGNQSAHAAASAGGSRAGPTAITRAAAGSASSCGRR